MSEKFEDAFLVIDDDIEPKITVAEAELLKPIQKKFISSYFEKKDSMSVESWLKEELIRNLPEYSQKEIDIMSNEIISTLKLQEEKKESLDKAIANGRSKESWFASEIKKATSSMSGQEAAKYLQNLDNAINTANESLARTIYTQAGQISQNPNLDGFIAEQYHAQTFNLNAEATGSPYRAKVLEPTGKRYAQNSVDIEIIDGNGHVVRRYQSKYCKDAKATEQAFKQGNYRGQQKLIPKGQESDITKKITTVIEAPDGTKSTPLTKKDAKELQADAQSGKWNKLNWNEYQVKDIAMGIGKQAGQAALMGAAVGVGFDVAQKVWNGEKIDSDEIVENAIVSGADFGIKAAGAGAIKVGVEKGIIKAIPKGTPAGTIANIVHVAVENVKVIGKMASGQLSAGEGVEKMEQVTVSTVSGIAMSTKGAIAGAHLGTVLGPVGTAVGGFVGGTIGYMAGSKVGETIVTGVRRIREKAADVARSAARTIRDTAREIGDAIRDGIRRVFCW